MRILVTGGTGQVAQALAARAGRQPDLRLRFASRPELDLEHPAGLADALGAAAPDLVINTAAHTAVDLAEDDPERAMRVNAEGAGALARATAVSGVPLLHLSTDYVFDGTLSRPYLETDRPNPQSVYGRTKLAGELAVAANTPNHLIVRTAWVYSPYGSNFVKTMLRLAGTRPDLQVIADQVGNPTSAEDLADGLLVAARHLHVAAPRRRLYHLAGTGAASWFELAKEVMAVSQALGGPAAGVTPIAAAQWSAKAPRPANSQLDSTAFAEDFGYRSPPWQHPVAQVVATLLRDVHRAG